MEFDWTSRTIAEWREYLGRAPRTNWLQSLPFARAVRIRDQKVTRLALIRRGGEAVGMMAMQEIKLGPIHVLNLYRGPLWFSLSPSGLLLEEFARLFDRTFPKRLLRRRRWLPEWRSDEQALSVLKSTGFRPNTQTYETIWLDLRESEAGLRAKLQQKWRNALNKGERSELTVKSDWTGSTTNLFLSFYQLDKTLKKYRGRSPGFVREEIRAALVFKEALILWAYKGHEPLAGILIFLHGKNATYRIGWTTPSGRKHNAHNVLLWEAVKALKGKNLDYFDLGGIEPVSAEGLTQFKHGLGGELFRTLGIFR